MIIHMITGIKKDSPEVQGVVDWALGYGIKPEIHVEQGEHYAPVIIYLKDGENVRVSSVPEHPVQSLPGVDKVVRVSPSRVSPYLNGNGKSRRHMVPIAPNCLVGEGQPTMLVSGQCTIDREIGKTVEALCELGVFHQRGGWRKPRSRPDAFRGFGRKGLKWFLEAAKSNGVQSIWTEVIESTDINIVKQLRDEVGFEGGIVLWVGARNSGNYRLLEKLGRQKDFAVMLKHGLQMTNIDQFMDTAAFVLAGEMYWREDGTLDEQRSVPSGNQSLLLCVRGLAKFDQYDPHRFTPNFSWITELRRRCWAPVVLDPSHMAGNPELVLEDLAKGLKHNPDVVLVESHHQPSQALCDKDQAIIIENMSKVIELVKQHNQLRRFV
jgi:3-deoxy-7-phosphoheptulonate synthase